MPSKETALRLLKDQQIVRTRKDYTETIKLREQTLEATLNQDLKKRFKQI